MEFSPTAIGLVVLGVLSVIVGIKGTQGAIFQTLTGHSSGAGGVAGGSISDSGEVGAVGSPGAVNMPSTGVHSPLSGSYPLSGAGGVAGGGIGTVAGTAGEY